MEIQRYKDCGAVFAEDLGSNNSQFTYTGTGITNSPYGRARTFNGTSDYILSNDLIPIIKSFTQLTIAFKFKYVSGGASGRLISILHSNGDDIRVIQGGVGITFSLDDGTVYTLSSGSLTNNNWYTAVGTFDGTNMNLYVNNVAVTPTAASFNFATANGLLSIGRFGGDYAAGDIKEIIIENRAWTTQEVSDYHYNKVFDYDKNIISRWNLDATDTIKDLGWKNLGNNGTVNGNPTLSDSPFGRSLVFNGTGDFVDTGINTATTFTTDFTISLWAKSNLTGSRFLIGSDPIGNDRFYLQSSVINPTICVVGLSSWNPTVLNAFSSNWRHYVLILKGTTGYFYIDGELKATQSGIIVNIPSANLLIGSAPLSSTWKGSIDKVAIFDKALTNIQVKDLMKRQLRGEL